MVVSDFVSMRLVRKAVLGAMLPVALITAMPISMVDISSLTVNNAYAESCPNNQPGDVVQRNTDGSYVCQYDTGTGEFAAYQTTTYDSHGKEITSSNQVPGGGTASASGAAQATSCSSWLSYTTNLGTCVLRTFTAGIGTILIAISAWILQLVSMLFNWLFLQTIVNFGSGIYISSVRAAVTQVWTAFRDIANVAIIGMLIFSAVATIIGLDSFGVKKRIGAILMVAIFINFSMLFTEMFLDMSNFAAFEFYQAAGGLYTKTAGQVVNGGLSSSAGASSAAASSTMYAITSTSTTDGIAGAFLNFIGITSVTDSYSKIEAAQEAQDSTWLPLLHGIFAAVMLLGVAGILLYGCVIITSRALLMIFLLATSSLAAGTYIIPGLRKKGWDTWWNTLWRNVVLAPILMILLWATLAVAATFAPNQGMLGQLINDPTGGANLASLFGYCIILGLLFLAFKISSDFSKSITGFSMANALSFAPVGLASRFGLAPLLRQTVGRYAYSSAGKRNGQAKEAREAAEAAEREVKRLEGLGLNADAQRFEAKRQAALAEKRQRQAGRRETIASSKMNLMDTAGAKSFTKELGVSGFAAGKSGGELAFKKRIDTLTDAAAKRAKKLVPSAKEIEEAGKNAEEAERKRQTAGGAVPLTAEARTATLTRDEVKNLMETERGAANAQLVAAQQALQNIENETSHKERAHNANIDAANLAISTATTPQAMTMAQGRLQAAQAARESEMRAQQKKIDDARKQVNETQSKLNGLESKEFEVAKRDVAGNVIRDAAGKIETFKTSFSKAKSDLDGALRRAAEKAAKDAKEAAQNATREVGEKITEHVARNTGSLAWRYIVGPATGDVEKVVAGTRKAVKKEITKSKTTRDIEELLEAHNSGHGEAKKEAGAGEHH